jgi:hypothetical protein
VHVTNIRSAQQGKLQAFGLAQSQWVIDQSSPEHNWLCVTKGKHSVQHPACWYAGRVEKSLKEKLLGSNRDLRKRRNFLDSIGGFSFLPPAVQAFDFPNFPGKKVAEIALV